MYTPVNPSFTKYLWGVMGYSLYGHVSMVLKRGIKIWKTLFRLSFAGINSHISTQ